MTAALLVLASFLGLGPDFSRFHLAPTAKYASGTRCIGDCDRSRVVTVDELVRGTGIVHGDAAPGQCLALDCGSEGEGPTVACLVLAVDCALTGCPSNVAAPSVEGPVTGGMGAPFIGSTFFDLAEVGYEQNEYFISGTAHAYVDVGGLGLDGEWDVEPAAAAAYKTRILVYRPVDPQRFNGTVVVEWLNVSGGLDAAPDWVATHTELTRSGYAWVGVSAQIVGVEGGATIIGLPAIPLKTTDPERYGSLIHPGDSFSYDIFSQAAQALRRPSGVDPLGGLAIARVIAAGDSQSAFRLVTYANAIHPLADIYDAFLVHSRGGLGAALSESPQDFIGVPGTAPIRSDLNVPTLIFQTETDLFSLFYHPARQPDGPRVRVWEVAGTAHADSYTLSVGFTDRGDSPDVANLFLTSTPVPGYTCASPVNSGPQHFVLKAAIAALNRWARDGTPAPIAPRLETTVELPVEIVRDAHGNALGGIRTPPVDVPIATLSGEGQSGTAFCGIFGRTLPFDGATLASLYPDHEAYVSAVEAAADGAVAAGFLLTPDANLMKTAAAASDIGG